MAKDDTVKDEIGDFEKVYKRYGAQLDKEDNLINNRVGWLLATQTILFAAVKFGDGNAPPDVLHAIKIVGFYSSIAILFSVFAACLSFVIYRRRLHKKYKVVRSSINKDSIKKIDYPQLGRNFGIICAGHLASIALPVIFAAGWLLVKTPAEPPQKTPARQSPTDSAIPKAGDSTGR
jgi:hypothetical protein